MPEVSSSELRRFGLTVGGMFLVLGALSRWRGHVWPPIVFWTLGGLLLAPAVVLPGWLRPVQRAWMGLGAVLGEVNGRILLTLVFYLVLTPVGFILRRFVRDPLDRTLDDGRPSAWIPRAREPVERARYEQQF